MNTAAQTVERAKAAAKKKAVLAAAASVWTRGTLTALGASK